MDYINKTVYDQNALGALNRLAVKTVQKQKTFLSRAFCFVFGILGLGIGATLLFGPQQDRSLGTLGILYGVMFLGIGTFWTRFQTWTSRRMLTLGVKNCTFSFDDFSVTVENEMETNRYLYRNLYAAVEDENWYVLFLDKKHGIVLDKSGFTMGEAAAFRAYLEEKIGQPVEQI